MKRYMKRFLPVIAALCLTVSGCAGQTEESSLPTQLVISGEEASQPAEQAFPAEICGVTVQTAAQRAVSLSPSVTEIISELGFADRLCAVSVYCDYPELSLPTAGSSENPDIEAIIALKPDTVFTLSALAERDIYALNDAGCTVIQLEAPRSIEQYGSLYSSIAAAFMGTKAAQPYGEEAVKRLKKAAEGTEQGSFIYVTDALTAAGTGTFESAVLSLCGENLCTGDGYAELAELSDISPDRIIVSGSLSVSDVSYDKVLSVLIYNGAEVIFVPSFYFERPSLRTADVFKLLAADAETAEE